MTRETLEQKMNREIREKQQELEKEMIRAKHGHAPDNTFHTPENPVFHTYDGENWFPGPKPKEPVERAPGVKMDEGKPELFAGLLSYFPRACAAVAEVSKVGATAPGHVWGGWQYVPDGYSRYTEALTRHLLEEASRGKYAIDHNDGLFEAAKVAWNAMCRLELMMREIQTTPSVKMGVGGEYVDTTRPA